MYGSERTWLPVLKTDDIGPVEDLQSIHTCSLDTIKVIDYGRPQDVWSELPCPQVVSYDATKTVDLPA